MAKKKSTPAPGTDHHFGMALAGIVAVIAVVGVVILIGQEIGAIGKSVTVAWTPHNLCEGQCGPGEVGQPIGHKGMAGYDYCLCQQAKQ